MIPIWIPRKINMIIPANIWNIQRVGSLIDLTSFS